MAHVLTLAALHRAAGMAHDPCEELLGEGGLATCRVALHQQPRCARRGPGRIMKDWEVETLRGAPCCGRCFFSSKRGKLLAIIQKYMVIYGTYAKYIYGWMGLRCKPTCTWGLSRSPVFDPSTKAVAWWFIQLVKGLCS